MVLQKCQNRWCCKESVKIHQQNGEKIKESFKTFDARKGLKQTKNGARKVSKQMVLGKCQKNPKMVLTKVVFGKRQTNQK